MQTITGILLETAHTFAGDFPDIAVSEAVTNELVEQGEKPLYVTLPVGKVDIVSRNDRRYPREAIEALVDAINRDKPGGIKGHLKDDERPYRFDIPSIIWLGAKLEADGTAWAKGIVLKSHADVHEYVRLSKAAKSPIATSIYGTASVTDDGTVSDLSIESIDLVHPKRAGVAAAVRVPVTTSEAVQDTPKFKAGDFVTWGEGMMGQVDQMPTGDDDMALVRLLKKLSDGQMEMTDTTDKVALAAMQALEMSGVKIKPKGKRDMQETITAEAYAALETQLADAKTKLNEAKNEVRDLKDKLEENADKLADFRSIGELLGNPKDTVTAVRALKAEKDGMARENTQLLEETIKGLVAEAVKLEAARPMIVQMITDRKPARRADVVTIRDEILATEAVKTLLKFQVQEQAGPPHQRGNQTEENGEIFFDVPAY